jgi:hypothetical protein
MATLLSIIQDACDTIGIAKPSNVIGNTNQKIVQLLAIANREGRDLASRNRSGWVQLIEEATFTTVAVQSQGPIETLAPGYRWIINGTIWNRTQQRPVFGPDSPVEWQAKLSSQFAGPYSEYRLKGKNLEFYPVPTAGENCAFEYVSKNFCESSGGTGQNAWQADDDTPRLDSEMMTLGIIWRWKKSKDLNYAEDFNQYERFVMDELSTNATSSIVDTSMTGPSNWPQIIAPTGGIGQ